LNSEVVVGTVYASVAVVVGHELCVDVAWE
jgi:hypothetical protein